MKIELPVRWTQRSTDPEALEARKLRRLNGDEDEEDDDKYIKYTYDYMVFDVDDVREFHRLDDNHTVVAFYDMDSKNVIALSYEAFKEMYQEFTRTTITRVEIVEFLPEKGEDEKTSEEEDDESLS